VKVIAYRWKVTEVRTFDNLVEEVPLRAAFLAACFPYNNIITSVKPSILILSSPSIQRSQPFEYWRERGQVDKSSKVEADLGLDILRLRCG